VLIEINGPDDHNRPGDGLDMSKARNGDLHAEFARYAVITQPRTAQQRLTQ